MSICIDKMNCCGCGACAASCPADCITMKPDAEGFDYPIIDRTNCVNCHKCIKVCPYNSIKNRTDDKKVYIGWAKNEEILETSSSGGFFRVLADYWLLNNKGIVYGAGYDNDFNVIHTRAENSKEIKNLQTSKYVQSRIGETFKEIKAQLDRNIPVMFVGTPCQVTGLKKYLDKDYDKLLLVDLKCHGVPSPAVWTKYLEYLKKFGSISRINFRNKDKGWHNYALKIEFDNKKIYYRNHYLDKYLFVYFDNRALRPCCYKCEFDNSYSDITLADAWKVERFYKELKIKLPDDKGISLIGVNSQKGMQIINIICKEEKCCLYETSMKLHNPHLIPIPPNRDIFFENLHFLNEEDFWDGFIKIDIRRKLYVYTKILLEKLGVISFIRKHRP